MKLDTALLRRYAPFAAPLLVLAGAWILLISPTASANARAARDLDLLRQRLSQVRAVVSDPAPQPVAGDPAAVFARAVAARDASSQVLEQLAALAKNARAVNLAIETGDRVVVSGGGSGPQVTGGGAQPDPRFSLFVTPLAYSPISMSFDADFASAGQLLWQLRDLPTTVEVRTLEIRPLAGQRRVHVALSLFAFARDGSAGSPGTGALQ